MEKNYDKQVKNFIEEIQNNFDFKNSIYRKNLDDEERIKKHDLEVDKTVKNIEYAIMEIEKVNMSNLYELPFNQEFECEFIRNNKKISFLANNKEEAEKILEEERKKLKYKKDAIKINTYERFGFLITEILLEGSIGTAKVIKSHEKYFFKANGMNLNNINMYSLIRGCDSKIAIEELCELLRITIVEVEEIKEKYKYNIEYLKKINKKEYPNICELLKKGKINYIDDLQDILNYALQIAIKHNKDVKEREVFSVSLRALADSLRGKKSRLLQVLNAFCILGFIQKVRKRDTDIKFISAQPKDISIFYIPKYDIEILKKAEKNAEKFLKNKKLTISNLNSKTCKEKFGEQITKQVYFD